MDSRWWRGAGLALVLTSVMWWVEEIVGVVIGWELWRVLVLLVGCQLLMPKGR